MKKEVGKKKNSWFQTFKVLWKEPRTHAMIKLSMYFIFLAFVLIILKINRSVSNEIKEPVKTPLEVFQELKDYRYQLTLNEVSTTTLQVEASGVVTNEIHTISLPDHTYIYNANTETYQENDIVTENPFSYSLSITTPAYITKMIEESTLVATTNYRDGGFERTYEVPLTVFLNDQSSSKSDVIQYKIKEKDDKIERVEYDLTPYRSYQDANIKSSLLTITYEYE